MAVHGRRHTEGRYTLTATVRALEASQAMGKARKSTGMGSSCGAVTKGNTFRCANGRLFRLRNSFMCDKGSMVMTYENQVQIKDKFCLTIDEAAAYFNIGQKKLRKIVTENLDSGFVIQNGVKFLIKREQFEKYLDALTTI